MWWILGGILFCGCAGMGVIAAVLVPVFAQARVAAQRNSCMTSIKSLATAQLIYANDFDGKLPPASRWMDGSEAYLDRERFLHCPTLRRSGGYGYALNNALAGKAVAKQADPKGTILLFETTAAEKNVAGDPAATPPPNRHGPGRTEAYLDGSTRFKRSRPD